MIDFTTTVATGTTSVTASSTLEDLTNQYLANQFYALNGSLAEAKLFIAAAQLMLIRPIESEDKEGRFKLDLKAVREQLAEAKLWVKQFEQTPSGVSTPSRVTKASFVNFRD